MKVSETKTAQKSLFHHFVSHCADLMGLYCMGYDVDFTGPAAALPGHPDPARKVDAEGVLFWFSLPLLYVQFHGRRLLILLVPSATC